MHTYAIARISYNAFRPKAKHIHTSIAPYESKVPHRHRGVPSAAGVCLSHEDAQPRQVGSARRKWCFDVVFACTEDR